MRRSVLVIAHDESAHIRECLDSLTTQTVTPDEIVVIAHNCRDDTAEIARSFPGVRVEECRTEGVGPIFARIAGFEAVSGEVVACIDGDAVADPDWLERITAPFSDPKVAGVGGFVGFGNFFGDLNAWWFFGKCERLPKLFRFYFWGASFACRKSAYERCGGLGPLVQLRSELGLHFWAEDCFLSLALEKFGQVVYAKDAVVTAHPKPAPSDPLGWKRGWIQNRDRKALFRYF